MCRFLKRTIFAFICFIILPLHLSSPVDATYERFTDVPPNNWADKSIHQARQLNITQGRGNNVFGYGEPVRRSEFVKFLVSVMGWELDDSQQGSFNDNQNMSKWYYQYIETAVNHGAVIKDSNNFRPDDYITREDMALMIVRALGYDDLAKTLNSIEAPFKDVSRNEGYISMVKDMGIVTGKGNSIFDPQGTAKREEAIVMLMRMYNSLNGSIDELHGFYAISSYSQKEMMSKLDSVSFGWSTLSYDPETKQVLLSMSQDNKSSFYLPESFTEPVNYAVQNEVSTQLMVFATQETEIFNEQTNSNIGLVEYVLTSPDCRKRIIDDIISQVNSTQKGMEKVSFDGVVIDFECMRGDMLKGLFNAFLKELRSELGSKKLYVAVHPKRANHPYYDGYDYKTIGDIADKVILMAHDYYSTILTDSEMESGYNDTPLSPIDEIYYALHAAIDPNNGINDKSKIWLQICFDSVQWKRTDGKTINQHAFRPDYKQILNRLNNVNNDTENLDIKYNNLYQYAWFTYFNTTDKTENIIWYEDTRSILAKIRLARLLGLRGVSLWRLGNIPDYDEVHALDVWHKIMEASDR